MRRLRRLFISLLLLGLVAIAAIFTANTISFSSKQIAVEPVEPMKISYDAIERLSTAVKVPTVGYDGEIDSLAFRQFDTFLQKNYPLVDSLLEKEAVAEFSRVYKWQGQNTRLPPILLLAHTDVVPAEQGSLSKWKAPPFSGTLKDDFVWGRGTLDDKVAVCGILEAIELLLSVDYSPQRTAYVAFGHDEETAGTGAKSIAGLFKQRGLHFEFVLDEGSLVLEDAMPGLDKPVAFIGIAEKGYATLELSVNLDEGGHSSMPSADAAIYLLAKAIVRLRQEPPPAGIRGTVRQMLDYTGPEMDLFHKVVLANLDWTHPLVAWQMAKEPATNALLRTTLAPTMLGAGVKENVLPTRASARVNCRILPGESSASVMAYVRRTIADERVRVSLSPGSQVGEPLPVSSTETAGYRIIETTAKQVFPNTVVAPSLVIGATDSRHYHEVASDIYRFLPVQVAKADLKRFHGIDERIAAEQYRQAVRFYRQLILNACK